MTSVLGQALFLVSVAPDRIEAEIPGDIDLFKPLVVALTSADGALFLGVLEVAPKSTPVSLLGFTETTGDGADEFVSYSRESGEVVLRIFGAFNGAIVGQIPAAQPATAPNRPQTSAIGPKDADATRSNDLVLESEQVDAWFSQALDRRRTATGDRVELLSLFGD